MYVFDKPDLVLSFWVRPDLHLVSSCPHNFAVIGVFRWTHMSGGWGGECVRVHPNLQSLYLHITMYLCT